jgi:hypothetical protein
MKVPNELTICYNASIQELTLCDSIVAFTLQARKSAMLLLLYL